MGEEKQNLQPGVEKKQTTSNQTGELNTFNAKISS